MKFITICTHVTVNILSLQHNKNDQKILTCIVRIGDMRCLCRSVQALFFEHASASACVSVQATAASTQPWPGRAQESHSKRQSVSSPCSVGRRSSGCKFQ